MTAEGGDYSGERCREITAAQRREKSASAMSQSPVR